MFYLIYLTGLVIVATCVWRSEGYKSVVFMHGLLGGPEEFDYFRELIQQYHPGTQTIQISLYSHSSSVTNLWTQLANISDLIKPVLTNSSSDGTVLICYSQGGVICRGLLATIEHNVDTFISLSSPLAGQYGDTKYLKLLFPKYVKKNLYKLFYSENGQKFSVANYWNDPHEQEQYKKFSTFLALLNNESSVVNPKSYEFRLNFLRLKNLVLIGGPDDGVITPWQSSQFGMYNASEFILPMKKQQWYENDAFGLKTLQSRGSIYEHTIPGIHHKYWHLNLTVFETCIKPWLT